MAGYGSILIQFHKIMGTDIHAGDLVLTFATITFFGTHKTWHGTFLLVSLALVIITACGDGFPSHLTGSAPVRESPWVTRPLEPGP
jgi:hypothetical protein